MTINSPVWLKKTAFILQAVLIGLGLAFVWILLSGRGLPNSGSSTGQVSYAEAVARAQPAVVSIQTSTLLSQRTQRSRFSQRSVRQKGLGSGVIVDPTGIVLTNHHVIKGVDSILIILPDGRRSSAQIIGTDQDTDLAVLRIENGGVKLNLPTLSFADSKQQSIGDVVLAIGNPYGLGQTVTQGIISATSRANINLAMYEDFIQTDATITAGNSGGALINTRGELIGINTAVYAAQGENSGIGLAIPADLAEGVTREIIAHGRVIRGYLGIIPTDRFVNSNGQAFSVNKGTIISNVYQNSPAAKAGVRPYDILTAINDTEINSELEATYTVASFKPGTTVTLQVQRDGQLLDIVTTIEERPGTPGSS
ncbi:MAG: PDZ domain-containing protein [Gammaproteobacteria bacterium]|nr:trypsin-like peptidase domain-containing protein [Gammaproteobacteria bacterium]NNC97311.1 PDZ domain-containing protein [Gammaproteobacteria bacterium]NNM14665.1 PDZ domain-containing protein [Gammaproteobacteria bacterium]